MLPKKKFFRRIIRNGKDRYLFSIYLPSDFVKKLELEGAMTEVELENNSIMIRKIGSPTTTNSIQLLPKNEEKEKQYDFDDDEIH